MEKIKEVLRIKAQFGYQPLGDESADKAAPAKTTKTPKQSSKPLPTIKISNWGSDGESARLTDPEKTSKKKYPTGSFFK